MNGQSIQILVWNYHDDLVTVAPTPVQLSVKVPSAFGSTVTIAHARVDETHADAYTVWKAQGSPATPSPAQVEALRPAMEPAPLNPPQSIPVEGGSVSVSFDLPRFGLSLVTISPSAEIQDASADAAGMAPRIHRLAAAGWIPAAVVAGWTAAAVVTPAQAPTRVGRMQAPALAPHLGWRQLRRMRL